MSEVPAAPEHVDGGAEHGRIDALDGLRAVSIALVVLGHAAKTCPPGRVRTVVALVGEAGLGVSVFFVLSGYLITRLLLGELRRNSFISLRAFYARRVFRIFPALYAYLLAVLMLVVAGRIVVAPASFLSAMTFTWNYPLFAKGEWWLAHCWSLSVEEQFYFVWPLLLVLCGPRRAQTIAVVIILLEPIVRTVTYFEWPSLRPYIGIMGHTRIDTILMGCVLALFEANPAAARLNRFRGPAAALALGALVANGALEQRFRGAWLLPVGLSVQGVAIALLVSWAVRAGDALPARLLRARPVTWLGRVSYSLYLWQQLFLADAGWAPLAFPVNIIGAVAAASASYYVVEQPVLRARRHALARVRRSKEVAPLTA